jgi:o-succinylbenzoate synthase
MSRTGLRGVELVRLRLPLRTEWITTAGRYSHRDVLLTRVVVADTDGWGECVAQAEPTYSAEYVEAAADVLARHLIPRLLAAPVPSSSGGGGGGGDGDGPSREGWEGRKGPSAPALAGVKGHPMAKAALEMALLDAHLKIAGRSLASHLGAVAVPPVAGPPPATVVGGVAVGVSDDAGALVDEVGRFVAVGYRRVKLKVHPGWDQEPVSAVRDRWSPDQLMVQVDANGSYAGLDDAAAALGPLDDYHLLLVEQPLGDDDLLGHAALASRLTTPVCLDESITSADVAATALALGACRVINIKAGRVGGLLEAVRVHDLCRAAGVAAWCGGMLETGIGRAANLALAALPGFVLPGDLSAADRFWADDIVTEPARLAPDGTLTVPTGPGLGAELRDDLGAAVVSRRWFAAP